MRSFFKYLLVLFLCIAFAFVLSYLAFYSFWFAARTFHSVPVARACDAIGSVVLLPARGLFYCMGGQADQSIPFSNPMNYLMVNAVSLGFLLYCCIRNLIFREKPAAKPAKGGTKDDVVL